MKKYIFCLGITMIALVLIQIKPTYGLEEQSPTINSNQFIEYIENNKIVNIKKLCAKDFCDYLRSNNIKRAFEIFKQKYQEYLIKESDEETALSTILKGFELTIISQND